MCFSRSFSPYACYFSLLILLVAGCSTEHPPRADRAIPQSSEEENYRHEQLRLMPVEKRQRELWKQVIGSCRAAVGHQWLALINSTSVWRVDCVDGQQFRISIPPEPRIEVQSCADPGLDCHKTIGSIIIN